MLRAFFLLPPAGVGGLIGVLIGGEGPTEIADVAQLVAVLLICIALSAAELAVVRLRTVDEMKFWGHSRGAWVVLLVAAFFVGLVLAVSG